MVQIMCLLLAAADRQQADRADGRRHHPRRRSLRQGRDPQDPVDRGHRSSNKDGIKQVFSRFLNFGDGKHRRRHAGQRGMADQAQLDRDAARHRPAFLGQPHAGDGFGQAAAGTRSGDELHRIQLHDPAGLRLRRAQPALRLPAADGRLGPVGQHRQRHRSRPPHGHAAAARPDHAADHHGGRRQDGQDRLAARSGSTPT